MPRKQPKTFAQTLIEQMERLDLSSGDLARRLEPDERKRKSVVRKVKRWRSGRTTAIARESALALEKALGTRGVFTAYIYEDQPRGTRAVLAEQIASYENELIKLRKRVERLEKGTA